MIKRASGEIGQLNGHPSLALNQIIQLLVLFFGSLFLLSWITSLTSRQHGSKNTWDLRMQSSFPYASCPLGCPICRLSSCWTLFPHIQDEIYHLYFMEWKWALNDTVSQYTEAEGNVSSPSFLSKSLLSQIQQRTSILRCSCLVMSMSFEIACVILNNTECVRGRHLKAPRNSKFS